MFGVETNNVLFRTQKLISSDICQNSTRRNSKKGVLKMCSRTYVSILIGSLLQTQKQSPKAQELLKVPLEISVTVPTITNTNQTQNPLK